MEKIYLIMHKFKLKMEIILKLLYKFSMFTIGFFLLIGIVNSFIGYTVPDNQKCFGFEAFIETFNNNINLYYYIIIPSLIIIIIYNMKKMEKVEYMKYGKGKDFYIKDNKLMLDYILRTIIVITSFTILAVYIMPLIAKLIS